MKGPPSEVIQGISKASNAWWDRRVPRHCNLFVPGPNISNEVRTARRRGRVRDHILRIHVPHKVVLSHMLSAVNARELLFLMAILPGHSVGNVRGLAMEPNIST